MNTSAACPYCGIGLPNEPKRKTKCRKCGNAIYVRGNPEIFPSPLLRHEEACALDLFRQLGPYGITAAHFHAIRRELVQRNGKEPYASEVVWLIARRTAETLRDLQDTSTIYYQMALFLNSMGRDATPVLEKATTSQLLAYKQEGARKVKISVLMGDSCKACRKLNGKKLTIDEALGASLIPCKECSYELHDEKHGFCRCSYDAVP